MPAFTMFVKRLLKCQVKLQSCAMLSSATLSRFSSPVLMCWDAEPQMLQLKSQSTLSKPPPVLTLYTKDPCPLCDEALDKLAPFLDQVKLEKVYITDPGNESAWKKYRYDIPVFHFNGKYLMKHKADLKIFTKALDDYFKR